MPEPINYLGLQQTGNPLESLVSGLKAGAAINQVRQQSQAADLAKQYQSDVQSAIQSGDPRAIAALQAKYPEQGKALKGAFDSLNQAQKEKDWGSTLQVYSALQNSNPEAAIGVLDQHITAMKNSGEDASDLESIKSAIQRDPNNAKGIIGIHAAAINPEGWAKFATEQRAAEAAPYELSEAKSRADIAAAKAKFAESTEALKQAQLGWDIRATQNNIDVSRQNVQIAKLQAEIAQQKNERERQESQQKLQDLKQKREQTVRDLTDQAQTGADNLNQISSTIGELLSNPESLAAATGASYWRGSVPGTEAKTAATRIDQLKSLLTVDNLGMLKGAMSDSDREFLVKVGSNLDRGMSEEDFMKEINKINGRLPAMMDKLNTKYGSNFTLYKNEQAKAYNTDAPPPGAVRPLGRR